jgi:hypothetical protein
MEHRRVPFGRPASVVMVARAAAYRIGGAILSGGGTG